LLTTPLTNVISLSVTEYEKKKLPGEIILIRKFFGKTCLSEEERQTRADCNGWRIFGSP